MNESESWIWDGPPDNIHVVQADQPHMRVCFLTSNGPTVQRANLIAAAPELLAALKAMAPLFADFLEDAGGCDHQAGICLCSDHALLESARAAIAKAEGREPQ